MSAPLAYRARPQSGDQFIGMELLLQKYPFLRSDPLPSLIISGPPGVGKTSLAHLLAKERAIDFYELPALEGASALKKMMEDCQQLKKLNIASIIFIDEIHRFNKLQQDLLLNYLEKGSFTLIGATTENPSVALNRAILSRTQQIKLQQLSSTDLLTILQNCADRFSLNVESSILQQIIELSGGDARQAINLLEIYVQTQHLPRDRSRPLTKDDHYNLISALIKSLRGSDPHAATIWLHILLNNGEDPYFIARRLIIFASEDIGNADIHALPLAIAAAQAIERVGMPEASLNLTQVVTYLASTVKSNASYLAQQNAQKLLRKTNFTIPPYLKNNSSASKDYQYVHQFKDHFVDQLYIDPHPGKIYQPTDIGHEQNIKKRLNALWPHLTAPPLDD